MVEQADSEQFQMLSLMIEDTTRGMCIYQAATAKEQRLIADELKRTNRKTTVVIDMSDYAQNTGEIPTDIQQFRKILDKCPQAQVVVVCNLQLCGLWMGDSAYIERLNYMRDQLMECNKMWVFGMTPYFSILLSRKARDLYTYIMYNCSFVSEEDRDVVPYGQDKEYTGDIRLLVSRFEEYKRYIDEQEGTGEPDFDMEVKTLQAWLQCADYLDYKAAEWIQGLTDSMGDRILEKEADGEKIQLCRLLSDVYLQLGFCKKALQFTEVRQQLIKELFHTDSLEMAVAYADMAFEYLKAGSLSDSREYCHKALQVYRGLGKEYSLETVSLWGYIAQLFLMEGKYDEAIEIYRRNIQIIIQNSNESNYTLLVAYNNLGRAFEDKGELSEALQYYRKSQELGQKYHSGSAEAEIIVLNNISQIFRKMGDLEQTRKSLLQAKKICSRSLGGKHETTASIFHNLAAVYCDLGQWNLAEKFYKKAIEIEKNMFGETRIKLANSYMNLAMLYLQQGSQEKLLDAYIYMLNSLKIREKVYPDGHSDIAHSYAALARLQYKAGRFDEALDYMDKAQKMFIKLYGRDSQAVKDNAYNIKLIKQAKAEERQRK